QKGGSVARPGTRCGYSNGCRHLQLNQLVSCPLLLPRIVDHTVWLSNANQAVDELPPLTESEGLFIEKASRSGLEAEPCSNDPVCLPTFYDVDVSIPQSKSEWKPSLPYI